MRHWCALQNRMKMEFYLIYMFMSMNWRQKYIWTCPYIPVFNPYKSSRPKKVFLQLSQILLENTWSLFFLWLLCSCFPVNSAKFFKITYFVEHLFCRKKKKEKQTLFSVRIRIYRSEEKHNFLKIFIDKYETLPGFQ